MVQLFGQASETQFSFQIAETVFRVTEFTAVEELSSPYQVTLSLASEDEIGMNDVLGREGLLTVFGDDVDRYFHGIVSSFVQVGTRGRFFLYQAIIVPSLWLLSLEQDCRIFQNKTVPEIVSTILQDAGITSDRFVFRLQNQYEPREYCVQYHETDLQFISRLLEWEGIFYFFEHSRDKHLLVFGDSTVNYQPIAGEPRVLFHPSDSRVPGEEFIYAFQLRRQIQSGKITLRDFNFKRPTLNLTAQEEASVDNRFEIYNYPGLFSTENDGRRLARLRLEESLVARDLAFGKSYCRRLVPGLTFRLVNHDFEELNREYLLVRVTQKGRQPQELEERADSARGFDYSNTFVCIPSSVHFRPQEKTPRPFIKGPQTAIVVGPAREESYLDDEHYGMVKVQFHWDREGRRNEHSSCWIRVAYPYAGENHGAQFTPLIGDEVLVEFLEGNPDRPVIVGSLFKGEHKALVKAEDMTKNEILTPYQHKISLDDKGGEVTISTGANYSCRMSDPEKLIHISTPNGRFLSLDDRAQEVRLNTEHGSYLRLHDPSKTIRLETEDRNFLLMEPGQITVKSTGGQEIVFQDSGSLLKMKNNNGHCVKIQSGDPNILVSDSNLTHKIQVGPNSINIFADTGTMTIQTKAGDLVVRALGQTLKLEGASGRITIDNGGIHIDAGSSPVEIRGSSGTISIGSSGIRIDATAAPVEVKGTLIKLNC